MVELIELFLVKVYCRNELHGFSLRVMVENGIFALAVIIIKHIAFFKFLLAELFQIPAAAYRIVFALCKTIPPLFVYITDVMYLPPSIRF